MRALAVCLPLVLLITACSGNEKEFVFDEAAGPDSKALVKSLPDGLSGDEANRNYSRFPLIEPSLAVEPEA
ncbi:MAG: hypothetical protein ACFB22_14505 [Rhodothalassiaceae bacterium]